jgi:hypothetical protein
MQKLEVIIHCWCLCQKSMLSMRYDHGFVLFRSWVRYRGRRGLLHAIDERSPSTNRSKFRGDGDMQESHKHRVASRL